MGRSNGYRPKAAVREEVLHLRALLSECDYSQWQKASMIMAEITSLLGHSYGPMGGRIEPRACKTCGYFGHTRQHCPKRKRMEEAAMDRILQEDAEHFASLADVEERPPYSPTKCGQALTFDELRMPYSVDPDLGPLVGVQGEVHRGKWTFDDQGCVVLRDAH